MTGGWQLGDWGIGDREIGDRAIAAPGVAALALGGGVLALPVGALGGEGLRVVSRLRVCRLDPQAAMKFQNGPHRFRIRPVSGRSSGGPVIPLLLFKVRVALSAGMRLALGAGMRVALGARMRVALGAGMWVALGARMRVALGAGMPLAVSAGAVFALSGCSGSQTSAVEEPIGEAGANDAASGSCVALPHASIPALTPPAPKEAPASSLWIELSLPVDALEKRLAAEIPQVLAQGKNQPVGAPGKATFVVRRQTPRLKVSETALSAVTRLNMDISVCKPFGSTCIRYGSCKPTYDVEVSLPARLNADYSLPRPTVRVLPKNKCVIAIDVTPQITKIVKAEAAKAERELVRQMSALQPDVGALQSQLTHPISVSDDKCAWLNPTALSYQAPRVDKGMLQLAFGVDGTLAPAACDSARKAPELPKPKLLKSGPRTPLHLPEFVPFDVLTKHLSAHLDSIDHPGSEAGLTLSSLHSTELGLLLELTSVADHCGTFWVRVVPRVQGAQLLLAEVSALDATLDPEFLASVAKSLKQMPGLPLDAPSAIEGLALSSTLAQEAAALPIELGFGLSLEIPKLSDQASVTLTGDGLLIHFELSPTMKLRGESQ